LHHESDSGLGPAGLRSRGGRSPARSPTRSLKCGAGEAPHRALQPLPYTPPAGRFNPSSASQSSIAPPPGISRRPSSPHTPPPPLAHGNAFDHPTGFLPSATRTVSKPSRPIRNRHAVTLNLSWRHSNCTQFVAHGIAFDPTRAGHQAAAFSGCGRCVGDAPCQPSLRWSQAAARWGLLAGGGRCRAGCLACGVPCQAGLRSGGAAGVARGWCRTSQVGR
jgi:hypothetical protein